jgi:subtilisin
MMRLATGFSLFVAVAGCTQSSVPANESSSGATPALEGATISEDPRSVPDRDLRLVELPSDASAVASASPIVPDEYIVLLRDDAGDAQPILRAHGITEARVWRNAINGFWAAIGPGLADELRNDARVLSVTPNLLRYGMSHGICPDPSSEAQTGVRRMRAHRNTLTSSAVDADIAVIDTGIAAHPDLNLASSVDCQRCKKRNGAVTSCESCTGCTVLACEAGGTDQHGHGTHVAGIAAASKNGSGVQGVAQGARVHAVRVLGANGNGTTATIINGLDYISDPSRSGTFEVANLSLGGSCVFGGFLAPCDDQPCATTTDPEHRAICRAVAAGIPVVVAAGNDARDARYFAPAAFDEAITVSALADFDGLSGALASDSFAFSLCTEAQDDSLACFSNYSGDPGEDVDVIAPGVGICSTGLNSGYRVMSGTSMAAPHVAGAVALEVVTNGRDRDLDGDFDAADVEAIAIAIRSSGTSTTPCGASPGARCSDDPDGIQEPLVLAGPPCIDDAECGDGNACNGTETCDLASGDCRAGTAVSCSDGDACTTDTCDPASGSCSYSSVTCNDNNACTSDLCSPATGCSHPSNGTCPTCAPQGTSCTSGAQCCSGRCRRGACS